ncbi:MAG: DUF167 domain-containing protein [Desulfobacterales bacterium]|nr:DUF167 domain-containing protein [Desulfobacterales bacterium]
MSFIEKTPKGLAIRIFVQPKSSKNMTAGVSGNAIKIKLTAPPVNDAANRMCIHYLAKQLGVPKSSLKLVSGRTGRSKTVLFQNTDNALSDNEWNRLKQKFEDILLFSKKRP